jgi:hypothetical protein
MSQLDDRESLRTQHLRLRPLLLRYINMNSTPIGQKRVQLCALSTNYLTTCWATGPSESLWLGPAGPEARLSWVCRISTRPCGPGVTRWDDADVVSETNCIRQPFSLSDIGQNKATVLINRLNMFWGTNWSAIPNHFHAKSFERSRDQSFDPAHWLCRHAHGAQSDRGVVHDVASPHLLLARARQQRPQRVVRSGATAQRAQSPQGGPVADRQ